ncbi:hypothetical protein [Pontibacter ramchanderi]|uniref:hypothetical protein n=1 Tax=Pontibacter ramchanderi TaxID=1179743 RepID=UPI00117DE62C|nr:hypothetical protein [Pontibacter ramchanderi]
MQEHVTLSKYFNHSATSFQLFFFTLKDAKAPCKGISGIAGLLQLTKENKTTPYGRDQERRHQTGSV